MRAVLVDSKLNASKKFFENSRWLCEIQMDVKP
jgi:hypothetical protein